MASTSINIQGQTLEVIVVGGTKLKNAAIVGKQDPFVELSYGNSVYRTNPCQFNGTNPAFHDKFMIDLIEGLSHIKISVYNLNTSSKDDLIGKGRVSLSEVIRKGCHDTICYLNNDSWSTGEIRLIMMYPNTLSLYEEMRAAKEKAENELTSYKTSAPQLMEVTHMKHKLAEQDKELAILRSELINVDKLKLAAESTLKQMQATLDEKDTELDIEKNLKEFEAITKDAEYSRLLGEYEAAINGQEKIKKHLYFVMSTVRNDLRKILSRMNVSEEEKALGNKIIEYIKVFRKMYRETSCETIISETDQRNFDFGAFNSSLEEEDSE